MGEKGREAYEKDAVNVILITHTRGMEHLQSQNIDYVYMFNTHITSQDIA